MKQGYTPGNLKNIKDGCYYGYMGPENDGSDIQGPVLSVSAMENLTLQIKASSGGDKIIFRIISGGKVRPWKEIALVQ